MQLNCTVCGRELGAGELLADQPLCAACQTGPAPADVLAAARAEWKQRAHERDEALPAYGRVQPYLRSILGPCQVIPDPGSGDPGRECDQLPAHVYHYWTVESPPATPLREHLAVLPQDDDEFNALVDAELGAGVVDDLLTREILETNSSRVCYLREDLGPLAGIITPDGALHLAASSSDWLREIGEVLGQHRQAWAIAIAHRPGMAGGGGATRQE